MTADPPIARYIVIAHDGVWKINLNNQYFGPFTSREAAIDVAKSTAQAAVASGHVAQVLLMDGAAAFKTIWDGAPDQS